MSGKKTGTKKAPKVYSVAITQKLRNANCWFESNLEDSKMNATAVKMRALQATGPQLRPQRLIALADRLERTQRILNRIENRYKKDYNRLLAHWAHTGIEEIQSRLG